MYIPAAYDITYDEFPHYYSFSNAKEGDLLAKQKKKKDSIQNEISDYRYKNYPYRWIRRTNHLCKIKEFKEKGYFSDQLGRILDINIYNT